MSIQHLEAAAETPLHSTSKLVLMAIADDANKETRKAFPGMPKMMLWSGASEARVQNILQELIAEQYIARVNFGRPGKRAEWLLFPSTDEIDAIEAKNPGKGLNKVSPDTMRRVLAMVEARDAKAAERAEQAERRRTKKAEARVAKRLESASVDNFSCPPPVAGTESAVPTTQSAMPTTGEAPPVITSPSLTQSSEPTHLPASSVRDGDDGKKPTPTPLDVIGGRLIDLAAVQAELRKLTSEPVTERNAATVSHIVMSRAKRRVANPTSYITRSIANDAFEWQRWLHDLDADRSTENDGQLF